MKPSGYLGGLLVCRHPELRRQPGQIRRFRRQHAHERGQVCPGGVGGRGAPSPGTTTVFVWVGDASRRRNVRSRSDLRPRRESRCCHCRLRARPHRGRAQHPHEAACPGGRSGERLELPESIDAVLRQVAEALLNGMGVCVVPLGAWLTTQEAADYLGISRPTLVRILERGEVPIEKPGRHRFVRLIDLIEHQSRMREQQRAALEELSQTPSISSTGTRRRSAVRSSVRAVSTTISPEANRWLLGGAEAVQFVTDQGLPGHCGRTRPASPRQPQPETPGEVRSCVSTSAEY